MKRMRNQQKAKTAVVAVDQARVAMATSQQLVADASSSDPFLASFRFPSCLLLSDTPSRQNPPFLLSLSLFHASSCHNLHSPSSFSLLIYIGRFSSIRCGAKGPNISNHMGSGRAEGKRRGMRWLLLFSFLCSFVSLDIYCSRLFFLTYGHADLHFPFCFHACVVSVCHADTFPLADWLYIGDTRRLNFDVC